MDEIVRVQLEKDKKDEPKPLDKLGRENKAKLTKYSNGEVAEVVEPKPRNCSDPNCLQPLNWRTNGYLRNRDGVYCYQSLCRGCACAKASAEVRR